MIPLVTSSRTVASLYDLVLVVAVVLLVLAQGALLVAALRYFRQQAKSRRTSAELAMALTPALVLAALVGVAAQPAARQTDVLPVAPAYALDESAPVDTRSALPGDPARGRSVFMRAPCVTCHTIAGTPAQGNVAPRPLTRFATYPTIANVDGLANNADNLRLWLRNPHALKPNTAMPNLNLSAQDIEDLTAYLLTLK